MAVEMEGMSARVEVVEYDFYDVVVFKDVRVRVDAVDGGVVGKCTGRKCSEEGWDFGADVGYLVEECAMIASQMRYS